MKCVNMVWSNKKYYLCVFGLIVKLNPLPLEIQKSISAKYPTHCGTFT